MSGVGNEWGIGKHNLSNKEIYRIIWEAKHDIFVQEIFFHKT